jgi:repressor LexA
VALMMARKRKKGLSERHKRILKVLEYFQKNIGYPPSIREICDQADISSTSVVNYYLDQLQEMGYIQREGRVSRGIRLLKPLSQGETTLSNNLATSKDVIAHAGTSVKRKSQEIGQAIEEMLQIPVLGRIVAGSPMPVPPSDFSYFDAESMINVASSLLPTKETGSDLFALHVKGDSMIDAMVNDGDIVIMKPTREAINGELVAVWLNDRDETTLKYFYKENGSVRLQPANPTMQPIYINDPSIIEIQGKVIMVIRQIEG